MIVFTGGIDAAEAVEAELRAAGIETRSMANTDRLAGYGEIFSLADVAVPRRYALEASHVLRLDAVDSEAGEPARRRRRRLRLSVVAAVVLLGLLLGSVYFLLPR